MLVEQGVLGCLVCRGLPGSGAKQPVPALAEVAADHAGVAPNVRKARESISWIGIAELRDGYDVPVPPFLEKAKQ